MEGYWQGVPDVTPLGPWNSLFNFTILPIDGTTNEWLLSDFYAKDGALIPGTEQQWWTEDGVGMTYCGLVYNFFRIPGPVRTNFTEDMSTDTQIRWCQDGCDQLAWTLTLLNENTLLSHFYFANPVNHLNVTLTRVSSSMPRIKSIPMKPPCNISVTLTPEKIPDHHPKLDLIVDEISSGCPFRQYKEDRIPSSNVMKNIQRLPKRFAQDYEFCYVLNEATEFSVSWNFRQNSSELDVALSIPTSSPETMYLGLGFMPKFPGMIDADVAMGYVSNSPNSGNCVRSMYVPYYVGPPVDDNSMTLSNTDVIVENNRLTVQFTRPLDSGHHNITVTSNIPGQPGVYFFQTMWAIGEAPSSCTGTPNYHGNNRGLRVIDWYNPSSIFPDFMKCQYSAN